MVASTAPAWTWSPSSARTSAIRPLPSNASDTCLISTLPCRVSAPAGVGTCRVQKKKAPEARATATTASTRTLLIAAVFRRGDSPCVAKLQIHAAVVPDALCVLQIHHHALHGLEHEVDAAAES